MSHYQDEAFERQIRKEFLDEADELVQKAEASLLQFRTSGGDQGILFNELFRIVHTIKGSALSVGFDGLGAFAHRYENLLELLRARKLAYDAEKLKALVAGADTLRDFVSQLKAGHAGAIDTSQSLALLEQAGQVKRPEFRPLASRPTEPSSLQRFATSELRPLVLICDDDPDMLELLTETIAGFCQTIGFTSSREALAYLAQHTVDLVITDFVMPDVSGLDLVRKLRETDQQTAVIFISGMAGRQQVIEFLHLGVFDFIEKPLVPEVLQVAVGRALRHGLLARAMIDLSGRVFRAHMRGSRIGPFGDLVEPGDTRAPDLVALEQDLTEIGRLCNDVISWKPKIPA